MRLILPLALAACLLAAACGGGSALRDNERILASLPEMPAGQRLDVRSEPYYHCDDVIIRPVRGYYTNVTYQAATGTTAQQVIDFYVERLKGDWQYRKEYIGVAAPAASPPPPGQPPGSGPGPAATANALGRIPVAYFERGTATVGVNTDNMALREIARTSPSEHLTEPGSGPDFTISVDSRGTIERPYCD